MNFSTQLPDLNMPMGAQVMPETDGETPGPVNQEALVTVTPFGDVPESTNVCSRDIVMGAMETATGKMAEDYVDVMRKMPCEVFGDDEEKN